LFKILNPAVESKKIAKKSLNHRLKAKTWLKILNPTVEIKKKLLKNLKPSG